MKIIPQIIPQTVIKLYWEIIDDGKRMELDEILWSNGIDNITRQEDENSIKKIDKKTLYKLHNEFLKIK